MENGHISPPNHSSIKPPQDGKESTTSIKSNPSANGTSPAGHKRTLSGSILAFPFFGRSQPYQYAPKSPSRPKPQAGSDNPQPSSPRAVAGGAMASAMQHKKVRNRKGSLRKTALLGTGKARIEGKEEGAASAEEVQSPQPIKEKLSLPAATTQAYFPTSKTPHSLLDPPSLSNTHPPPFTLPNSASTTDEDELSPPKPAPSSSSSSSSSSSKDPHPHPRPLAHAAKSPLGSLPPSSSTSSVPLPLPPQQQQTQQIQQAQQTQQQPLEWDYAETAAWGWALLVGTWIVFVVGMGSCLGVWSWAWDVGETPYAPPELEDDPTLPIVGYYPALIILTGVMAWVWVVVAWVGMKYFRHAKMGGEEG